MTKISATTQNTWFAKASFVKQNNQNLGSKLGKKKKKDKDKYWFWYT